MRKLLANLRYKLGSTLIKLGDSLVNGPVAENPVFVEWMGEDISWRLMNIKDCLGEALNDPTAFESYKRNLYVVENDHEHCDGCRAPFYKDADEDKATRIYYAQTDQGPWFCPVCFALFKAVCRGELDIKLTRPDALTPYQRNAAYWKDLIAAEDVADRS